MTTLLEIVMVAVFVTGLAVGLTLLAVLIRDRHL